MKNTFSTKVKIIIDSDNGFLEDYPKTSKYTFEFNATDLNIHAWMLQFKHVLKAAGFLEKTIDEYLGEDY